MSVAEELELVRRKNGEGMLVPEEVVEFAKNPKTELHSKFTWDDSEAAHQYRLWQARMVIRVTVTIIPREDTGPVYVRAYQSLPSDRKQPGGGYRETVAVLREYDQRQELLDELAAELARMKAKCKLYKGLSELYAIIEQAEVEVAKQSSPRRKRA